MNTNIDTNKEGFKTATMPSASLEVKVLNGAEALRVDNDFCGSLEVVLPPGLLQGIDQVKAEGLVRTTGHIHKTFNEDYYVLEGGLKIAFYEPDKDKVIVEELQKGDRVIIPAGVSHKVIGGSHDNQILVSSVPGFDIDDEIKCDILEDKFSNDSYYYNIMQPVEMLNGLLDFCLVNQEYISDITSSIAVPSFHHTDNSVENMERYRYYDSDIVELDLNGFTRKISSLLQIVIEGELDSIKKDALDTISSIMLSVQKLEKLPESFDSEKRLGLIVKQALEYQKKAAEIFI